MFPKLEKNKLVELVNDANFPANTFHLSEEDLRLEIKHRESGYFFRVFLTLQPDAILPSQKVVLGYTFTPDILAKAIIPGSEFTLDKKQWGELPNALNFWLHWLKTEYAAPDLWAEAAKTAQLFAPTSTPTDDKFTRTELAEVQGQLRLLQQSFATAALPEAARQKLLELTQTAAVKAEGLTKKDWQNWLIGGFISAIASCALNPTQAAEVLKLVKAAFGGLFLH